MRPVRFVALSEDGQALVLADEVGRLLALPLDERVSTVVRADPGAPSGPLTVAPPAAGDPAPSLSPRDIQARIRAGESAEDVARIAGVPVDRVLRYAGPVLQERAMLAQHARRTRLRSSEKGTSLAEVVDGRLAQHGVDSEKISWDAYRRDDGTWRIIATWPSGKATAQAVWELDKTRQNVMPHDDMAQYLCVERPAPLL
ncbi:MAG TPA: septation protein SepH, partial [Micromonosporaceae bacterium]|nr:septation protein SepH [Micromonosporaceae bacterium]